MRIFFSNEILLDLTREIDLTDPACSTSEIRQLGFTRYLLIGCENVQQLLNHMLICHVGPKIFLTAIKYCSRGIGSPYS